MAAVVASGGDEPVWVGERERSRGGDEDEGEQEGVEDEVAELLGASVRRGGGGGRGGGERRWRTRSVVLRERAEEGEEVGRE